LLLCFTYIILSIFKSSINKNNEMERKHADKQRNQADRQRKQKQWVKKAGKKGKGR
jgi:hypothetical protein